MVKGSGKKKGDAILNFMTTPKEWTKIITTFESMFCGYFFCFLNNYSDVIITGPLLFFIVKKVMFLAQIVSFNFFFTSKFSYIVFQHTVFKVASIGKLIHC